MSEREKPTRVMVTTRKLHTIRGQEHPEGEVYEVDADDVPNLVAQGLITAPEVPATLPTEPTTPEPERERRRVGVIASKYHTLHGEAHQAGDIYDADEDDVATLINQNFAHLKDPAPEPAPEPSPQPVEPMTSADVKPAE